MTEKTPVPSKLEWEDPEPAQRKGSKWDPIGRALRAHPGQWACIGRNIPTSIKTTINRGELKCFQPAGAFEAVTRNHSDRWRADVYARYIGDHGEYAQVVHFVNPDDFETIEGKLQILRDSRDQLVETMANDSPTSVFVYLCASVIALHQVIEQMLLEQDAAKDQD